VRPERSAAGRFSVPIAETGAWLLAHTPERWDDPSDFDRPRVRIGVNAGGHLERVAAALFPNASRLAVPDNAAVLRLLADEKVHAVVTDGAEAPHWEARVEAPLARIGPLTRDRKAWLVRPDRPDLARDLDRWLLAREADGTLARLRAKWLGDAEPLATAEPLGALLAALDERLALMPLVAVVKRSSGVPLVVIEREERVLDHAVAALRAAAERDGREAPPDAAVRALFRAQMEAAKQVQRVAVKHADDEPGALPDLDRELRPALLRIGERVVELVLVLPPGLPPEVVHEAARESLRAPHLDDASRAALADAIAALSAAGTQAPESATD
jgi:cyclohexadienyl dehydratase